MTEPAGLVVLLNLNVLMVTYGDGNDRSRKGFNEIGAHLMSGDEEIGRFAASIFTTLGLAVLILVGYVVLVVFLGITEVPILVKEIKRDRDKKLKDPTFKPEKYRDGSAFNWFFVGLVFNIGFIYMHNLK